MLRETNLGAQNGAPVSLPAWRGGFLDWQIECTCQGQTAHWEKRLGLVLDWWFAGRVNSDSGRIVATDAPVY